MEEILKYFSEKEFIISLLTTVIAALYTVTSLRLFKRLKEKKENKKEEFFRVLVKGLENGTIQTHKDLINIYRGATNLSTEDLTYRYGLNKWLRELLTKVVSENEGFGINKENTKDLFDKITSFIDKNEEASPFSDLPDTERNMLSDITEFIKNNSQEAANRKIKELSSVIQTRHEEQKKIEGQNKWAIPLAIVGVILTIIFGLLSLFT